MILMFSIISKLLLGTERCLLEDLPARWQSRRTWAHWFLQKHQNHNCWTSIDKTTTETYWNLPKKIPYTQRQRRCNEMIRGGTVMIKSSLLPARLATHKLENSYTTEIFPQEWNFWALHWASQPWSLGMRGVALTEFSFEDHLDLAIRLPQNLGKQKLHS